VITSKEIINHIYINYDEKVINYYTFYDDNLQICSGGVAGESTGGEQLASSWQAVVKGGWGGHPRGIAASGLRISKSQHISAAIHFITCFFVLITIYQTCFFVLKVKQHWGQTCMIDIRAKCLERGVNHEPLIF
jgi:hypothetical protein